MGVYEKKSFAAISMDPVYIGTGGYTIGRVDNTIVRDPVTRIPKIPASSVAGTWRYYMMLELYSHFKDEYRMERKKRNGKDIAALFEGEAHEWVKHEDNRYAAINCAGQDESPEKNIIDENAQDVPETGHCGRCIVCKTFGFSKNNKSMRGRAFFSDLYILFFPVYTMYGTRWVTSPELLQGVRPNICKIPIPAEGQALMPKQEAGRAGSINLGWMNLSAGEYEDESGMNQAIDNLPLDKDWKERLKKNYVVVADTLISNIINANLEVRTSVSIDPMTGAAKEGALFTSEAVPRGTVFVSEIVLAEPGDRGSAEFSAEDIWQALEDSKKYYEIFGIGGMVTRGFGRMKIFSDFCNKSHGCEGGEKGDEQSGESESRSSAKQLGL